jgi:hypothetical protein
VGCWDDESELAQHVATLHWLTVATEARITLHPELITFDRAQTMKDLTFTSTH